jgi:acyl-CoA synthetase (NDP forming)
MYVEGIEEGEKLLRLAKKTSLKKPIVLWKGGLSEAGAATAASHTGSMAGEQKLWKTFFRQTGVVPVDSMDEWADTVLAFSNLSKPAGNGVFLLGGGGGNSVTGSDLCVNKGLIVPRLSEKTMEWLTQTVPSAGSIAGNPLDDWRVFGDPLYLGEVLDHAYRDPNISMVIIDRLIPRKAFHSFDERDPTPLVIDILHQKQTPKPTVFIVDSEGADPELAAKGAKMRALFGNAGIPAFPSLKRAAQSLFHLYYYHDRMTANPS